MELLTIDYENEILKWRTIRMKAIEQYSGSNFSSRDVDFFYLK